MNSMQKWHTPPSILRIEDMQIHVWRGKFCHDQFNQPIFTRNLSDEEHSRAGKFIKKEDRDRFLFAHGMLRSIVAIYLNCSPRQVRFKRDENNKPILADRYGAERFHFNLSHSKDAVLVALSETYEIGVDVEYVRSIEDLIPIINSNFSDDECKYLLSLTEDKLHDNFFTYWTLKEAFLKGIGIGLLYPLKNFTIKPEYDSNKLGRIYNTRTKNGPLWQCLKLNPFPGYVGGLASKTISTMPKFWNFKTNMNAAI